MGMYTDLYDRQLAGQAAPLPAPLQRTSDTAGWGAGGGVIVPVMPKLVDLNGSALVGRGIGRYGSAGLGQCDLNA